MERKEREGFASGLVKHVADEESILGKYRYLGEALREGPAGLLIRAIFKDEQHHHDLLHQMARELSAYSEHQPLNPIFGGASRPELARMIEELLNHEAQTIENCRELKARFVTPESELFAALLEALISDSEKHQMLLLALNRALKE